MDKIISAKWATAQEIENFYSWLKSKNNSKNDFTSRWLVDHGDLFINLHKIYPNDYYIKKKQYYQDLNIKKFKEYQILLGEYNYKKDNLGLCNCGGNETFISSDYYNFIGCENWKDNDYIHTKIYPPRLIHYEDECIEKLSTFTPSSTYITQLRSFYDLPSKLKPSILVEYLLMNNIELYNQEAIKGNKVGVTSSSDSKTRENLVKSILEEKFDKVFYQKMIKAQFKYNGKKNLIPDFICIKGDKLLLIEQKKRADLIDHEQINNYLQCLKLLASRPYDIDFLVIVEFGDTVLHNNIVNFKDLSTYEFIR